MLGAAGVEFEVRPAAIDERALEAGLEGAGPGEIALALAEAKALSVDGGGKPVLGSDSVVAVEGQRFSKPASRAQAVEHLKFFSGRTMELHSAAAIILVVPIVMPVVIAVGIDPVHFGIVVTLNLAIGQQTPPVASVLMTACSIARENIWDVSKANLPFIAVLLAVLLLVTYVPAVPMFLVNFFYR